MQQVVLPQTWSRADVMMPLRQPPAWRTEQLPVLRAETACAGVLWPLARPWMCQRLWSAPVGRAKA